MLVCTRFLFAALAVSGALGAGRYPFFHEQQQQQQPQFAQASDTSLLNWDSQAPSLNMLEDDRSQLPTRFLQQAPQQPTLQQQPLWQQPQQQAPQQQPLWQQQLQQLQQQQQQLQAPQQQQPLWQQTPNLLQQDQQQQQQMPPQQPLYPDMLEDTSNLLGETPSLAQASSVSALSQMQQATASVPMKEVVQLMQSVDTLQRKSAVLEKRLLEGRSREKRLNDMADAATTRSRSIDQNARKLAQLAQTSVSQAQKSMDDEQSLVNGLRSQMVAMKQDEEKMRSAMTKDEDKLRAELSKSQAALSNSQAALKRIQVKEDSESTETQTALKDWQRKWAGAQQEKQRLLAALAETASITQGRMKLQPQQIAAAQQKQREQDDASFLQDEISDPDDLKKLEASSGNLLRSLNSDRLQSGDLDANEPPVSESLLQQAHQALQPAVPQRRVSLSRSADLLKNSANLLERFRASSAM